MDEQVSTAVLFVDVSGSTAFLDRYGEVAGRAMVKRFFGLAEPEVDRRRGRIIKYLGDGFLAAFPTPTDVVEAAQAIHSSVADDNDIQPDTARIRIHSGAHVGLAVSDTSGDLFGDVVNVAARVQAVAGPDQIYVTADLVGHLEGEALSRTRPVGRFPLKGKGKGEEVELHEVMWKFDGATMLVSSVLERHESCVSVFYDGQVTELTEGQYRVSIGRVPGNDVVVDDRAVSREHADVIRRKGAIYFVDHSTNGTFLRPAVGQDRHVHREEILLEGQGDFSLGRADGPALEYKVT